MPCSFVNLPREILRRIAYYLVGYKQLQHLRQFQLTNKLCQSIAEIYLYEKFVLYNRSKPEYMLPYVQLLLRPQRCKLVKHLEILDESLATLDESFFELFPNIQILTTSYSYTISIKLTWKRISEVFTAERCKLKQMPSLRSSESDINNYLKMLEYHHGTLETLSMESLAGNLTAHIIRYANNAQWFFPRVKFIDRLTLEECTLQDLDATINKCPMLEKMDLSFQGNKRLQKWVPDMQHQRQMTWIRISAPLVGFFDVCNYFLDKFPNTRTWMLSNFTTHDLRKDDSLIPLGEAIDFWKSKLLTKPGYTRLNFFVESAAVPYALDFFTESFRPDRKITITYTGIDEFAQEVDERDSKVAMVEVTRFKSRITKDMTTEVLITYVCTAYIHMDMLEVAGRDLQNLELHMRDNPDENGVPAPEISTILEGGAITHALGCCPALTSFEIHLPYFVFLEPPEDETHTNLEKMEIRVEEAFKESLLFELSCYAPNIKDFTIEAHFDTYFDDDRHTIAINMPHNNFDKLTVADLKCFASSEISSRILVQIISSTQPVVQSCFKRCSIGRTTPPLYIYEEEEFNANIGMPFVEIKVICKSIKAFKFCGIRSLFPSEFFTLTIN